MERCSAAVLKEVGLGIDFECVETKLKEIRLVVTNIERMACEAMENPTYFIRTRTPTRHLTNDV